jgi:thiamine-monophosphate kinase
MDLALSRCAHAMIDISDGLSSDLAHICEQSRVGALINAEKIPLSSWLCRTAEKLDHPPIHYALSGGEDYELLFTVPTSRIQKLQTLDLPLTEIGEITRTRKMMIFDSRGTKTLLNPTGYNHFARARK